ncbi:AAA family ATPase [Fretibacterium fastidiosum]|uniref:ATPase AAA-type core domain-containing protein n=1 Tax=Fretibacterium fastidiosum TaxID=651822 RepID=A0AB94IWA8_9BACT|nr:ATP-binding protein [Fretibacterium fastidiosum]CBL27984.1 hypothetical protein SY1_06000 [Fretibacterium fastidiosum]
MIRKLEIHNYKLFRNFALELDGGVNLLCGPNGSGKTSVIEIVYALTRFLAIPDHSDTIACSVEDAFPFRTFCRWCTEENGWGEMSVKLEIESDEQPLYIYDLTVRYNFLEKISRVQHESLRLGEALLLRFQEGRIEMFTDDEKKLAFRSDWKRSGLVVGSSNNSRIRRFGKQVASLYAFHLVPALMKQDVEKPMETLALYGENFAAWRFLRATQQLMRQARVVEQSKYFIPGLVDIRYIKKGDWHALAVKVEFNGRENDIEFNELSDGQKTLLALYSILANIPNGSTVLIDEPENFLALSELQPWLEAMNDAWEERDIQFIIISHNPRTLNWHNKNAMILSLEGTPPKVVVERRTDDDDDPLVDKLRLMEWEECDNA